MDKLSEKPPGKSWREINKEKKAQKRKWNEEKMEKRQKREDDQKVVETAAKEETEREKFTNISTVSIAVPGSILENAQSVELRTYLAGQIARAACVFCVDEIIVYDDVGDRIDTKKSKIDNTEGVKVARKSCVQLARILQYLECPQYLRKHFFPIHKDLQYAGILNPLDAPHHLRADNTFQYREGITMNKTVKPGKGSQVNIGLLKDISVNKLINPGMRVTVKILPQKEGSKKLKGKIVSWNVPRTETGVYWGYNVRIANDLSEVFAQSPYKSGYDLTIGTSDRGAPIDEMPKTISYNHALIMFGGLHGIEAALESDERIKADDASLLFDYYINTLPQQGSRTIRTEEAILITMAGLRTKLAANNKPTEFVDKQAIPQSSIYDKPNNIHIINDNLAGSSDDMSRFD